MALNNQGIEVPAGGDAFDPQGDLAQLATSLEGRIIVPVANGTARNALAAAVGASTTKPLIVHRADAQPGREIEITTNGTTWRVWPTAGSQRITDADSGYPDAGTLAASGQKVISRITLPAAAYTRVVQVHASTYLTYTQDGNIDAFIYSDSSTLDQQRVSMRAGLGQSFKLSGSLQVTAGLSPVIELRMQRTAGTGVITPTLSSLTRLEIVTGPVA